MKDCDGEFGTGTDSPQAQTRHGHKVATKHKPATFKKERKQK